MAIQLPIICYGCLILLLCAVDICAFHNVIGQRQIKYQTSALQSYVDIDESIPRDMNSLQEWAYNCGEQHAEGIQLTCDDGWGLDYYPMTSEAIAAGTCVMYVPSNMFLTSYGAKQEYGQQTESEKLIQSLAGADQFPLFYLFLKLVVEYEQGDSSAWYPWLNSLPRTFNNGAAMTPSCYDCLPPLAAKLCMEKRVQCINCRQALKSIDFVSEETKSNEELLKWIYNVVETRSLEIDGERIIIPMADLFNHDSAGHEVEISYDEEGSAAVYSITDIPAGSPLRISYGDYYLTNPSATFAKYGFIDESCSSTFCKMMDIIPSTELRNIGLSFSRMLFYNTGEVSEEVYDVLLYQILSDKSPTEKKEFYNACINGDEQTKAAYHQQYLGDTMGKLKKHVDTFLKNLDELDEKASRKDPNTHTRLPLIMAHNNFVRQTFMNVKAQVDPVVSQYQGFELLQ